MRYAGALTAAVLLLSGCSPTADEQVRSSSEVRQLGPDTVNSPPAKDVGSVAEIGDEPQPNTTSSAHLASRQPENSCSAEIGQAAAEKLVAICRDVSPATRPPCNIVNSCEMIRDEIARGKAFITRTDTKTARAAAGEGESAEAGADVVRRYYAAITRRDFGAAYGLWGNKGQASGKSRTAFSRGFSHTSAAEVTIGAVGEPEGAGGSVYLTIPVTVNSRLEDGTRQRFTGKYVLRRVSVPSASPADRQWRIASAQLQTVNLN